MYRYRRSACRAVTRHDDDDDRRAPVSTFFIVSSPSPSPLFVVRRSRGHHDLIDLSSHLRSPVFFYVRFTANARALNSPPSSSSCTHHPSSLDPPMRRFTPTMRKKRIFYCSIHDSQGTDSRASVVHVARKLGVPSPEHFPEALLLWTLPNDGHHRRYARKHARASLDNPPRASASCLSLSRVEKSEKKEEKRATLCV